MLNRWQKTIVDRQGNIQPYAVLMIRRESDQALITIYRDQTGLQPYPAAGQIAADENGYAYFYATADLYRITSQMPVIDWRDVDIGAALVLRAVVDHIPEIEVVADNIDSVVMVAANIDNVNIVASGIADVAIAADNMPAILAAPGAADQAVTSAGVAVAAEGASLGAKNAAVQSATDAGIAAASAEEGAELSEYWAARAEAVEGKWMPMGSVMPWPGLRTSIPGGFIPRDGQEVSQALYPDFYALLLTGAFPVIDEPTWQASPAMRGCFVLESSPGNFRMPDWNGVSPGAIDSVFVGGDGGGRAAPGVIQEDKIQNLTGSWESTSNNATNADPPVSGAISVVEGDMAVPRGGGTATTAKKFIFNASGSARTAARGNPVNTAAVWITKVADVAVNPGTVDIVALAAQVSSDSAALQTLNGELDSTIIYPNGGTESSPANVAINSRYSAVNPFPGFWVDAVAQVHYLNEWADIGFGGISNTNSAGVGVSQNDLDILMIETGVSFIGTTSPYMPWAATTRANVATPLPCRIRVKKLKGSM